VQYRSPSDHSPHSCCHPQQNAHTSNKMLSALHYPPQHNIQYYTHKRATIVTCTKHFLCTVRHKILHSLFWLHTDAPLHKLQTICTVGRAAIFLWSNLLHKGNCHPPKCIRCHSSLVSILHGHSQEYHITLLSYWTGNRQHNTHQSFCATRTFNMSRAVHYIKMLVCCTPFAVFPYLNMGLHLQTEPKQQ